ncbi:MAG: helix-turn-helix transcriptional regulator [bacterium]|nr:helix-turn-helix transcriptional regulator [bacterium]
MSENRKEDILKPRAVAEVSRESLFARSLRYWRKHRGLSQMNLALDAGISTRHLSFLETDRSRPGRAVVERLLQVLELEPIDQNALLAAAGFPLEAQGSAAIDADAVVPTGALGLMFERMLEQQNPYPGFVLNAFGDVAMMNAGARRLFDWLAPGQAVAEGEMNLFELYFAPEGFRQWVDDFEGIGRIIFAQVRQDLLALHSRRALAMLDHLMELAPFLKQLPPVDMSAPEQAVFESVLRKDDRVLRLQSAMAILGTPRANEAPGWRLETIFPVDVATQRFFEE